MQGIRREPLDVRKLARALLELAQQQAEEAIARERLEESGQNREPEAPSGRGEDLVLILGVASAESGAINPSAVLTQLLALKYESRVLAEVLPVSYVGAALRTITLIHDLKPRAIVLFGCGKGPKGLQLERTAKNHDQATQPDIEGRLPQGVIIPSAPENLDTTADVDGLVERLQELRGVTARSSIDPGGDFYNHIYFALLRELRKCDRPIPSVLVRIPAHPDRNVQRGAESIIESFLPAMKRKVG